MERARSAGERKSSFSHSRTARISNSSLIITLTTTTAIKRRVEAGKTHARLTFLVIKTDTNKQQTQKQNRKHGTTTINFIHCIIKFILKTAWRL